MVFRSSENVFRYSDIWSVILLPRLRLTTTTSRRPCYPDTIGSDAFPQIRQNSQTSRPAQFAENTS